MIWLSEIILQQTKVDQGLNYYLKFRTNYPTINDLAKADEQKVLSDWQGLGYYSRARNLHTTAKTIIDTYQGIFPNTYENILKLKGIGTYTAAAISSFAFDLPHAVVDGNVYRVLSRIFNIDTPIDSTEGVKEFNFLANELLNKKHPAEHNQAIMEFGAIQCTPSNPNCTDCIFNQTCLARINGTIQQLPVKKTKTKIRNRYLHFLHIEIDNQIIITQRTKKDIWQNMYQFPLIEKIKVEELPIIKQEIENTYNIKITDITTNIKHILSHQHLYTTFWKTDAIPEIIRKNKEYLLIEKSKLNEYPIPRVIDRYLEAN
jgi:A/G-specific adenine glycosylase